MNTYTVIKHIEQTPLGLSLVWFVVKGPGIKLDFKEKQRADTIADALNVAYFEGMKAAEE